MGKSVKAKIRKIADGSPKSKCCRKSIRCERCPVVIKRIRKLNIDDLSDKQCKKALKLARAS